MKTNSILDAINSNFLSAGFIYPPNNLSYLISNYFVTRKYDADSKGVRSARDSILKYYRLKDNQIDNIIITASTSESYLNILSNLNGGEVLFPCPSYPLFEYLSKYSNIKYSYYNLLDKENKFDIESLKNSISKDTKAVVIISPNNPTGTILSKLELNEVTKLCKFYNLRLIIDTVFDIFNFTSDELIGPNDITEDIEVFWLNGISKMFALPDLKLAWIYYQNPNENTLDELETFNDTFLNANYLSQYLLPSLFENSKGFQYEMISKLQTNIEIAKKINNKFFKCFMPIGGIHFLCSLRMKLESIITDEQFAKYLELKYDLNTHPLSYYEFKSEYPTIVMTILHSEDEMVEIVERLNSFANQYLEQ